MNREYIEAGLEFKPGSLKPVVKRLLALRTELRPTHYSFGEDEKREVIADPQGFVNSLMEQSPGPILTSDRCSYDFSLAAPKPIICDGRLDVDPALVQQLMVAMAGLNPIFGFACEPTERERRNRITTKQGSNTIESWVGRDTQKYIPGFYWLTLLPDALATKHGVPLSEVKSVALEHFEPERGQHLFRFYDRPEDWRVNSAVPELCASLPGVFDVEKVKVRLPIAKTFLELNSLLREWK